MSVEEKIVLSACHMVFVMCSTICMVEQCKHYTDNAGFQFVTLDMQCWHQRCIVGPS